MKDDTDHSTVDAFDQAEALPEQPPTPRKQGKTTQGKPPALDNFTHRAREDDETFPLASRAREEAEKAKPKRQKKTPTDNEKSAAVLTPEVDAENGTVSSYTGETATAAITGLSDPLQSMATAMAQVDFEQLKLPCFIVEDDWFQMLGSKRKPGVWYCYQAPGKGEKPPANITSFVCSPLYIEAVASQDSGGNFGRLLRFRDTYGNWIRWAMPMSMLKGSCEELRGELLSKGVEIDHQSRFRLADYLQWRTPSKRVIAATKTGWTATGAAFVLPNQVIGAEDVFFQSEVIGAEGAPRTGGNFTDWQSMAGLCAGNPVLMVSVCVALSGALLARLHKDSGGVHWVGDSSTGKTTALQTGASVWGGDDFRRTWRATSNGLEGVAALLNDTCLCLDEISEADPRDIGAIVYSLGNGVGKSRANRIGSARHVNRWRVSLLSTGERSIQAAMSEGGKQSKAGQLVRLVSIPINQRFGAFDDLHHFTDGRGFADHFKTQTARHYGHAGIKFVEHLLTLSQSGYDFGKAVADYEKHFVTDDSQAARVASRFAAYALAGELAVNAKIVPWQSGTALDACKTMFQQWLATRGNSGATEHEQILENVRDYLLKFGDVKFTEKSSDDLPKLERAGWFVDSAGERTYLFTPSALKDAGGSFDMGRLLDALDAAGWIADHDSAKRSKKTAIPGGRKENLYWIKPVDDSRVLGSPGSPVKFVRGTATGRAVPHGSLGSPGSPEKNNGESKIVVLNKSGQLAERF